MGKHESEYKPARSGHQVFVPKSMMEDAYCPNCGVFFAKTTPNQAFCERACGIEKRRRDVMDRSPMKGDVAE